jgi:hypothetical protein
MASIFFIGSCPAAFAPRGRLGLPPGCLPGSLLPVCSSARLPPWGGRHAPYPRRPASEAGIARGVPGQQSEGAAENPASMPISAKGMGFMHKKWA